MPCDLDKNYGYLWDGSDHGWVLVRVPRQREKLSIFNKTNRSALVIEDEEVHAEVCRRMQSHGCEVLNELPKRHGTAEVKARP